jgi:hypothetical protein
MVTQEPYSCIRVGYSDFRAIQMVQDENWAFAAVGLSYRLCLHARWTTKHAALGTVQPLGVLDL